MGCSVYFVILFLKETEHEVRSVGSWERRKMWSKYEKINKCEKVSFNGAMHISLPCTLQVPSPEMGIST